MRQWLVKLLGGTFVQQKLDEIKDELETFREAVFLRDQLKQKDIEIQRLTNLMLTRAGFIVPEPENNYQEAKFQPINKREPWPTRQKRLEQEDAKKQADELERRWKAKNQDETP